MPVIGCCRGASNAWNTSLDRPTECDAIALVSSEKRCVAMLAQRRLHDPMALGRRRVVSGNPGFFGSARRERGSNKAGRLLAMATQQSLA